MNAKQQQLGFGFAQFTVIWVISHNFLIMDGMLIVVCLSGI
jgi:hypothetical protein